MEDISETLKKFFDLVNSFLSCCLFFEKVEIFSDLKRNFGFEIKKT